MAYQPIGSANTANDQDEDRVSPASSLHSAIGDDREQDNVSDYGEARPAATETQSEISISPRPDKQSNVVIQNEIPTTELRSSNYIVWLVALYAGLAIFAWTVTCILTFHPITTKHYGASFEGKYGTVAKYVRPLYEKNEEWFRAARVIQSLVAILTIPLTSAVCSKAAVMYVQGRGRHDLSLRQTMVLADKGWTAPEIYFKLLTGRYKRYGTSFLILAIILNIVGGVVSPLQSVFQSSKTIRTPTEPGEVMQLADILDHFDENLARIGDNNLVPVLTRAAFTATSLVDPQSRLWTEDSLDCTTAEDELRDTDRDHLCTRGGVTLSNMAALPQPFLAQLPSGYSTGLLRQFLPRINSTATRERIDEAEFPKDCDTLPGAFYVHFARETSEWMTSVGWSNWSMMACMPANQTFSPWKSTRARQDFSEELYLNISMYGLDLSLFKTKEEQGGLFRITVDTTAGYFELPNYMNDQKPGPLLEDGPDGLCGADCGRQGPYDTGIGDNSDYSYKSRRRDTFETGNANITSNSTTTLLDTRNRGPLLTTALALFGEGSFLSTRISHPEAYTKPNRSLSNTPQVYACAERVPFMSLLTAPYEYSGSNSDIDPCIMVDSWRSKEAQMASIDRQMATFVHSLYYNSHEDDYSGERITNAFTAAAFLANEVWLLSDPFYHSWDVRYDPGADTLVPVISTPGMVLISVLLGLYLSALVALAVYSAWGVRWTAQLDSFAMMRIGASLAGTVQFRVARGDTERVRCLDVLPGGIGDREEDESEVGHLGLGASEPLRKGRAYACHVDRQGDRKPLRESSH